MDKSNFLKQLQNLTSLAHRRYLADRQNIATAALASIEPTGDATLDGMNRAVFEAERTMWAKAMELSNYARTKLEK